MRSLITSVILIFIPIILTAQTAFDPEIAVMNPLVNLENLPEEEKVVRTYYEYDDVTYFYPVMGAQVHNDDNRINMFPFAIASGNVQKYNSRMEVGLIFYAYDENGKEIALPSKEITFIIDGDRKRMQLSKNYILPFESLNDLIDLSNAKEVKARIGNIGNNIELNMSQEVRRFLIPFIEEIYPSSQD